MSNTCYVLVCRDCGGPPIPFPTPAERGKWAAAHTRGTGHESWQVLDHPAKESSE